MNISAVKKWVLDRGSRKGIPSLERINYILEELESPQHNFSSVVIGGTNGKGSVTSIAEAILKHADNYQIGSFTSPHLKDVQERIRLQGVPMNDGLWKNGCKLLRKIFKIMDKEPSIGSPGFFETVTALALWAFSETDRDLVLLEVGLGGRFDSTNATTPEISVITNIGSDHKEFLGETKQEIAFEKLGIIRKKRPLITSEEDPIIIEQFKARCKELDSPFIQANPDDFFKVIESTNKGHLIKTIYSDENILFKMLGNHQLKNLATALALIKQLKEHGFEIDDKSIINGIASVTWPGRLEWVDFTPPILLDSAHNIEGLRTLLDYIDKFPPKAPIYTIFGTHSSKPFQEMLMALAKVSEKVIIVPPNCPGPIKEDVMSSLPNDDNKFLWRENVTEAIELAKENAQTILITGSIYLLSDAMRYTDIKCSNQE